MRVQVREPSTRGNGKAVGKPVFSRGKACLGCSRQFQ
jgi:hypothetical protein